jgi:hypothetical protein
MSLFIQAGKLRGPFRGFKNQQTRFTFSNGITWRQSESKYFYFYAGNPRARVMYREDGVYILEVDGTEETVEVVQEA